MIGSRDQSLTSIFIDDVKFDTTSPTTSEFNFNLDTHRLFCQTFFENLDCDIDALQRLKKSSKLLYEAGVEFNKCEQDFVVSLDHFSNLNSNCETMPNLNPEISAAWLKFCVIFKDVSLLTQSLVQSIKNNLLFPLDNLLKSADIKEKSELRKSIDKAFKDYDVKLQKCEKQHKSSQTGHLLMSKFDLAENLVQERTLLQYELCKFYSYVNRIENRKGPDLLQHLVDFYRIKESFYKEGLNRMSEFEVYIFELVEKLGKTKHDQDNKKKQLNELSTLLRKSPFLIDVEKTSQHQTVNSSFFETSQTMNTTDSDQSLQHKTCPSKIGFLNKKSAHKVAKSWLKRKCQVSDGCFFVWHSDELKLPLKINLLTCQIRASIADKKCFDIISFERNYHFQAQNEIDASKWVDIIAKNRSYAQHSMFNSTTKSENNPENLENQDYLSNRQDLVPNLIQIVKHLPGNDRCCDCDSTKDVTWISTNFGSIHCIDCSGIHRELGVQVSRIQSITLDYVTVADLLLPMTIGNDMLNEIFESKSSLSIEPKKWQMTQRNHMRKNHITDKYAHKKLVKKIDIDFSASVLLCSSAKDACIRDLLIVFASGFDLNSIIDQENMENALFLAVRFDDHGSHLPYIHFLVQNGVNTNLVNLNGDTTLHLAVKLNKPEVVKLLCLSQNLRLSIMDALQETAKQLAQRLKFEFCLEILMACERQDRTVLTNINLPWLFIDDNFSNSIMLSSSRLSRLILDHHSGPVSPISLTSHKNITSNRQLQLELQSPPTSPKPVVSPRNPINTECTCNSAETSFSSNSSALSPGRKPHLPPGATLVLPPISPSVKSSTSQSMGAMGATMPRQKSPAPVPAPRQRSLHKPILKRCRALYDCKADLSDELSFEKGDTIIVTRDSNYNQHGDEDDNWLTGYVETKPDIVGLFPVTFVTFEK